MTPTLEIALLSLLLLALVAVASLSAYYAGRRDGIARGWLEYHFKQIGEEMKRRGPDGRFRRPQK